MNKEVQYFSLHFSLTFSLRIIRNKITSPKLRINFNPNLSSHVKNYSAGNLFEVRNFFRLSNTFFIFVQPLGEKIWSTSTVCEKKTQPPSSIHCRAMKCLQIQQILPAMWLCSKKAIRGWYACRRISIFPKIKIIENVQAVNEKKNLFCVINFIALFV